jgi:hypothetical protein
MEHSTTSATGTGWERTPWHATQRAPWEALAKEVGSSDRRCSVTSSTARSAAVIRVAIPSRQSGSSGRRTRGAGGSLFDPGYPDSPHVEERQAEIRRAEQQRAGDSPQGPGARRASADRPTVDKHLHSGRARDPPLEVLGDVRLFRCTTMSNSASGNDRDGLDSRSCSLWSAQMPRLSPGSSNGSRISR